MKPAFRVAGWGLSVGVFRPSWLGYVATLCGVGGPSPVLAESPVGCGGPPRILAEGPVVACPCPSWGAAAVCRGRGFRGRSWGGFGGSCSPPFLGVGWLWLRSGRSSAPRGGGPCGCCLPPFPVAVCRWLRGGGGPVSVASNFFWLQAAAGYRGCSLCLFRQGPTWVVLPTGLGRRLSPTVVGWVASCPSRPWSAWLLPPAALWVVVRPFPGGGPVSAYLRGLASSLMVNPWPLSSACAGCGLSGGLPVS